MPPVAHTGVQFAQKPVGGGGQPTSVNANNSLILRRASGLPVGAFTITLQGKFAAWTGNTNQNIIYVEGPGGQGQIYSNHTTALDGTIQSWNGSSGATLYNAVASYSGWGMYYLKWGGTGQPYRYGVIIGGVAYETTGPELGNISDVQVMGLTIAGSNQSDQLYGCSFGIFAGEHTAGELLAQDASDTPLKTANGWCPMDDAATVGTATSGTSATVVGTGVTVSDSPY